MNSCLKYPGGQHYDASWIVSLRPEGYTHYVEPFAGGLSVLFAMPHEGVSEVANDICHELGNFWNVMRNPEPFAEFKRMVEAMPVWEFAWETAHNDTSSLADNHAYSLPARLALSTFVHIRQSLAARGKCFTGITKTRVRRGMNAEVSAWLTAVEGLPQVHDRLKRVLILNRPASEVIQGQDGPATLFYCDPPYLHETRETTDEYGPYEMTSVQHAELLAQLARIKGKFMLSGYHSKMYDDWAEAHSFRCHEKERANSASHQETKPRVVSCLWTNY